MAATTSCRLPLLRRPLPPKPSSPPPSASPVTKRNVNAPCTDRFTGQSTAKRRTISPLRGLQYQGDVPLPQVSVVQSWKTAGPDPLPARTPRRPRELPPEAFIKDSFEVPPPVFTLRDFLKENQLASDAEDLNELVISDQNYEKLTNWMSTNKPQQVQVQSPPH